MATVIIYNIYSGIGSYMTYIISQTTAAFIFMLFILFLLIIPFGGTVQTQLQLLGISQIFFLIKTKILKNAEITVFPRLNTPNFLHI